MDTHADVFILETLHPDDEGNGRFEGGAVSHVLRLHNKTPLYRYVRTQKQFKSAILDFKKSKYRYLHISAHGDRAGLCTTNGEEISYADFADFLTPALKGKRLFLSACGMVHEDMAREVIPVTGCVSVVGPTEDIQFATAAVFWPAIYHLMFSHDNDRMTRKKLKENLHKASTLFETKIGYFSQVANTSKGYTSDVIEVT